MLASRTLGLAPLLRPATPSRFEPEGPQAGLREIVEVREVDPDLAPATLPAAGELGPAAAHAHSEGDDPLLGFREPDVAEEHPHPALEPERKGRMMRDLQDTEREPPEPAVRVQRAADPPTEVEALARVAALMYTAETPSERAAFGELDAAPRHPAGRGEAPESAAQSGRSRQKAQAAEWTGDPSQAGAADPPIVVRIGRVDVRAVHAPPPAAPRPRPAAGPSLAEHLLARDRGRT